MSIRRGFALALAVSMACGSVPALAAGQAGGAISGKAVHEAKAPYSNYSVRLRDIATGTIAKTTGLDRQGQFAFADVALSQRFAVELFDTQANKVVCTEGPYALSQTTTSVTKVDINCGVNPAAWWLAAAGGAAAAIAVGTQSNSQ
jgi:hypothetical protein